MRGIALPQSTPLQFGPTVADVALASGLYLLVGWAMEETTGAASARLVVRDGTTAGAPYRVPMTLAAGESTAETAPAKGVMFERGLYLNVTAGSIAGCLFVVPADRLILDGNMVIIGQSESGWSTEMGEFG